jgi:hypothetical protein
MGQNIVSLFYSFLILSSASSYIKHPPYSTTLSTTTVIIDKDDPTQYHLPAPAIKDSGLDM